MGWCYRCMPRGRGRRPRAVARSRACEDSTRTPRGRAKAQNVHCRAWAASFAIWSEPRNINYVNAEYAPEGRLVTPKT